MSLPFITALEVSEKGTFLCQFCSKVATTTKSASLPRCKWIVFTSPATHPTKKKNCTRNSGKEIQNSFLLRNQGPKKKNTTKITSMILAATLLRCCALSPNPISNDACSNPPQMMCTRLTLIPTHHPKTDSDCNSLGFVPPPSPFTSLLILSWRLEIARENPKTHTRELSLSLSLSHSIDVISLENVLAEEKAPKQEAYFGQIGAKSSSKPGGAKLAATFWRHRTLWNFH